MVMWENAFALVVWICNAYVIGRELWKHLGEAGRARRMRRRRKRNKELRGYLGNKDNFDVRNRFNIETSERDPKASAKSFALVAIQSPFVASTARQVARLETAKELSEPVSRAVLESPSGLRQPMKDAVEGLLAL